ncbi:MAG: TrkA C-terminal domain-containing protein [Halobacteriaceae archaeon]
MILQIAVGGAVGAVGRLVGVAVLYRWYARERAPRHAPLLVALAAVAGYLNVKTALGQAIAGQTAVLTPAVAAFNAAALVAAAVAAPAGSRAGDRLAVDLAAAAGAREVEGAVSPLVRAVGRVIAVTLPEDVEDIEGYDPAPAGTKADLAGTTLTFPKGLTVAELRERLVARLREEYEVGHVDVELTGDGEVAYLAVGDRVAGLGPTLAPGAAAVAVTADPAHTASAGDVVQLWAGDPPERVTTAEIRAVAGDAVTLAVDAHEARGVAGGAYRLVTMPGEPRPEHEFAGLLRAADETMAAVRIAASSPLVGLPVGAVDATVTAVRPADGAVEPIPARSRPVAAGDTLYVVTRPETIRRLEALAGGSG